MSEHVQLLHNGILEYVAILNYKSTQSLVYQKRYIQFLPLYLHPAKMSRSSKHSC